jgi:hypothetical protein
MLVMHDSCTPSVQRLEDLVRRQTFALQKLERDKAYTCEIRAARRILKLFEDQLQASRHRSHRGASRPARP